MAAKRRPSRSRVARISQSSRASWYLSTRRSPAITTHSNLAPDFESAGIIAVRDVQPSISSSTDPASGREVRSMWAMSGSMAVAPCKSLALACRASCPRRSRARLWPSTGFAGSVPPLVIRAGGAASSGRGGSRGGPGAAGASRVVRSSAGPVSTPMAARSSVPTASTVRFPGRNATKNAAAAHQVNERCSERRATRSTWSKMTLVASK